jgi:hypothetical protein
MHPSHFSYEVGNLQAIVGTHCCDSGNRGHYWNIVATVGTKVIVGAHCYNSGKRVDSWLTTMTLNHSITTVSFDTIVAFVFPFQ